MSPSSLESCLTPPPPGICSLQCQQLSGELRTLKPGWNGSPPKAALKGWGCLLAPGAPTQASHMDVAPCVSGKVKGEGEGLLHPPTFCLSLCLPVLSSSVLVTFSGTGGQFSGFIAHEHSPTWFSLPHGTMGRGGGSFQSLTHLPPSGNLSLPSTANPFPLQFPSTHVTLFWPLTPLSKDFSHFLLESGLLACPPGSALLPFHPPCSLA